MPRIFAVLLMLHAVPGWALTEWSYHKTADGAHPDGNEQQLLWLMNRARQNPIVEGRWLAESTENEIAYPRQYFNVNTSQLRAAFNVLPAMPPAAFDVRLFNAARAHSLSMIQRDSQDHVGQIDKVKNYGFDYLRYRGNVFSYATSALNAHAGFNIDWGNGPFGMQDPAGHRMGIMSIDSNYANVGISVVLENNPATEVGDMIVTQNFTVARTNGVDHFNAFITGTVWQDLNANGRYDPNEGVAGVTVTPSRGEYYAVTSAGGGYAVPVTQTGQQEIRFSGGGLNPWNTTVNVPATGMLVDYKLAGPTPANPEPTDAGTTTAAPKIRLIRNRINRGQYGRAYGTNRHATLFEAQFTAEGRDLSLSLTGYDIDTSRELEVQLNGRRIGFLLASGNGRSRAGNAFSIPAMFQNPGLNTISFISRDRQWGVTNLLLRDVTGPALNLNALSHFRLQYGWGWGTKRNQTVIKGRFTSTESARHLLFVNGFNILTTRSVAVYINGKHAGYVRNGHNGRLAPTTRVIIPAEDVRPGGNTVEFHMLHRPGTVWGLTRARIVKG